jgi:hypothetical protein
MKALYMGLEGVRWSETSMDHVAARYLAGRRLTHHALRDAQDRAEILREMLGRCLDPLSVEVMR